MTEVTDDLKPCPFCGGAPQEEPESNSVGSYWIICDNVAGGCGCEGPYRSTVGEAAEAWNRRAALSVPAQEAVKVKPLEWVIDADRPSVSTARTPFGLYFIYKMTGYRHEASGPGGFAGVFKRDVDAKAAVQADYEQRILSALHPTPAHSDKLRQGLQNVADSLASRPRELRGPFKSSATAPVHSGEREALDINSLAAAFMDGFTNGNGTWSEAPDFHKEMYREGVKSLLAAIEGKKL